MTYIALLRAVNLAGRNTVSMRALRDCAESLGLGQPRTLLQSGNLLFESAAATSAQLELQLETAARSVLGLDTQFVVRSKTAWATAVARNPFVTEAEQDPGHLVMMALKTSTTPAAVTTLERAIKGPELVRLRGDQLYVVYPAGIGNSRLTTTMIERALGTRVTGRNWNTVQKLLLGAGG